MEDRKPDLSVLGVAPPKSSFSTVLNGIGNGLMVAGGPFVLARVGAELMHKKLPKNFNRFAIITSAIGAGVGVYYGIKEGKHLDDYRAALSEKLATIDEKIGTAR